MSFSCISSSSVSGTNSAHGDLLEPIPSPPLSCVLGEIEFGGKPPFECSDGSKVAVAALTPGKLKHAKVIDINDFHSLAHAHASVLKATAEQHGVRLTGELVSCAACSMAKGNRAPTPHHTTARAKRPMELVHIDTAGPYPASLGGSRYVMFVDSASRLQRPYGTRDKSAEAIVAVVKHFIADMGVPRAFRSDNSSEYTNRSFVKFCINLGIRHKFTAPYTPQQNGPVESAISSVLKAGNAARLGVPKIYPDIRLKEVKGFMDASARSPWIESLLWASKCFNRRMAVPP